MGEAILITSGKGGSGKSTLSVNLGAGLARRGAKVLLMDTDAGLRALDLMLSVSGKVVYDLSDVLSGNCEPIKAIVDTGIENLWLLPAPSAVDDRDFTAENFKKLCRGLSHYYDYLLIDSPAGIGSGMKTAAGAADRALIITAPDPVSIRDADRVAGVLIREGVKDFRLVINRVVAKLIARNSPGGLDAAIDAAAVQLIGIVPEDARVTASVFSGVPVVLSKKSPAGKAFDNIARRVTGEDVPLMKL